MPVNFTEFIDQPWNTSFSPFTNLFERVTGNGATFYLVPLLVLTLAIYIKTQKPIMAAMFMMGSGAILSGGSIFVGATDIAFVFTIFTAIGIAGTFISIFFQRGG